MARKIARFVITVAGLALGPAILSGLNTVLISLGTYGIQDVLLPWAIVLVYVAAAILSAVIVFILSPGLINACAAFVHLMEERLGELSLAEIFVGVLGLIVGLIVAFLISTLTASIPIEWLRLVINALLYLLLGYLGWTLVMKRRGEVVLPNWFRRGSKDKSHKVSEHARPKILDTSVIIDGRIADICRTGIIEGTVVIPNFVLDELRHIADSADGLKRNRGRRGLDILKQMQEGNDIRVKVVDNDYEDIAEVDAKLLKLATEMNGVVVTNDYNLNKVAGVQRVPVLNINDLANAIKPVLLPGEEMEAEIVKEGKELNQGIAYLDDGTMIVVDGGKKHVGARVGVIVTSVLQTSAGRMIFAKLKTA